MEMGFEIDNWPCSTKKSTIASHRIWSNSGCERHLTLPYSTSIAEGSSFIYSTPDISTWIGWSGSKGLEIMNRFCIICAGVVFQRTIPTIQTRRIEIGTWWFLLCISEEPMMPVFFRHHLPIPKCRWWGEASLEFGKSIHRLLRLCTMLALLPGEWP